MKVSYHQLLFILTVLDFAFGETTITTEPIGDVHYVVTGQSFRINCIVQNTNAKLAPDVVFKDPNNVEIKNSSDKRVVVTNEMENSDGKAMLSLMWNSIHDNDTAAIKCISGSLVLKFNITVIPSVSVPKITVFPTDVTVKDGQSIAFSCNATITPKGNVVGVSIKWKPGSPFSVSSISSNIKETSSSSSASFASSSRLISSMKKEAHNRYYCLAVLKLSNGKEVNKYYKDIVIKYSSARRTVIQTYLPLLMVFVAFYSFT